MSTGMNMKRKKKEVEGPRCVHLALPMGDNFLRRVTVNLNLRNPDSFPHYPSGVGRFKAIDRCC